MSGELKAQSLFVADAKAQGGFARKMSHRFLLGVVDIYVKMPLLEHGIWVECKLERMPVKKDTIALNLTPHQRQFLRDNRAAGGSSMWCLFVPTSKGMLACCGTGIEARDVNKDWFIQCAHLRGRGKQWPITELLEMNKPK